MEQINITSSGKTTTVTHVPSFTSLMPVQSLDKICIGNKRSQTVFESKCQDEEYDEPDQMYLSESPGSKTEIISEVGSFGLEQDDIRDLNTRLNSTSPIEIDDTDTEKSIKADKIHQLESHLHAAGPSGIAHGLGPNKLGWPVQMTTEPEDFHELTNSAKDVVAAETTLQHILPTDDHSARQIIIKYNFEFFLKTFCDTYVVLDSFMSLVNDHSFHGKPEEREYYLSLACSYGYFSLVSVLLAMGTDVECRNINEDCTPLMKAASSGFVNIVELLLYHNGKVNASSSTGRTPLMDACAGGHVETVKLLLKYGANIKNYNENGFTPIMEAVINGHITVVEILMDHGADIYDHCKRNQESTLTLACSYGQLDMVRFLLAAGADQVLLPKDANIEGRGINGDFTPLTVAASNGFVEIVELLLEYGAAVNASAPKGKPPLNLAIIGGHFATVELLLKYGANVEGFSENYYDYY